MTRTRRETAKPALGLNTPRRLGTRSSSVDAATLGLALRAKFAVLGDLGGTGGGISWSSALVLPVPLLPSFSPSSSSPSPSGVESGESARHREFRDSA